jgi:hypothetical protein
VTKASWPLRIASFAAVRSLSLSDLLHWESPPFIASGASIFLAQSRGRATIAAVRCNALLHDPKLWLHEIYHARSSTYEMIHLARLRMSEVKTVTITLEGGVIQDVQVPPGVRVEVMDFDVEGVDPADLSYNEAGEAYVRSMWEQPAP